MNYYCLNYICMYIYIPVAPARVEFKDEELFFRSDVATADVRTEIVEPPETAAFAGAFKS